MAFLPVGANRVPFILQQQIAVDNLNTRNQGLTRASNVVASGRRINVPSDDLAGATRAARLIGERHEKERILTNLRVGQNALSASESSLRAVADALDQAKALGLSNATDTVSAAERIGAAEQINTIIDQLTNRLNDKAASRYLFGGLKTDVAPLLRVGQGIRFVGEAALPTTLGEDDVFLPLGVSAQSAVGVESAAGRGADLNPAVTGATRLSLLNGGAGVPKGSFTIDQGAGPVVVALGDADNINDVLAKIQTTPGLAVTVSINAARNGLEIAGAGPITIRDLPGGSTAHDLGLLAESQTSPVVGQDLDPRVDATTPISSLRGGLGLTLSDGLRITLGTQTKDISFTGVVTVEDFLQRVRSAVPGVRPQINADATGVDILNVTSGIGYSITETSTSGTTGRLLGLLTTNLDTPLADFNSRGGVTTNSSLGSVGPDLRITIRDTSRVSNVPGNPGGVFDIDLTNVKTIRDLKTAIELSTVGAVIVDTNPMGGIRLFDTTAGGGSFAVTGLNGSPAAIDLGLANIAPVAGEIAGENRHVARVHGVLDNLIRLRDGLRTNNLTEIRLTTSLLDGDRDRLLTASGGLGAKLQWLDLASTRLTDDLTSIKSATAEILEADMNQAVTDLVAQQTALQAALSSTSRLLQGSLLDYL